MATNKQLLAQEIAKAVGAGKAVAMETVDFNDPNRPKTCLEVDFPILPINQIAAIEGKGSGALKPIYQTSKWWARRRSNVFRAMLIAAATKAPTDTLGAAKLVWNNYYSNHQKKGVFNKLRIADIFMGGGTTLVEGSRLGAHVYGNDLNPVAWFVVKQELASVDLGEVKRLLEDIEAEVKPQIMPYLYCDGPNGEKGKWTHVQSKCVMGPDFDPLILSSDQRRDYSYDGPEIIYTFWSKHGPCIVTGCGHRTPIMTSPVMAAKGLSIKYWEHACNKCGTHFHVEENVSRIAPDVPFVVAPSEHPFSILDPKRGAVCPQCKHATIVKFGKRKKKRIELTLLVHPEWLHGCAAKDGTGRPFGGSAQDQVEDTVRWNQMRGKAIRLVEVRGTLPECVVCPETHVEINTGKDGGTATKTSSYTCSSCGTEQGLLDGIRTISRTAPVAAYAVQGYSKEYEKKGSSIGGKFFAPFGQNLSRQYDAACREWSERKYADLVDWWPKSKTEKGQESTRLLNHLYTEWWMLFNPRQLLIHSQLLRAIATVGNHSSTSREYVLSAFQQYLRNQNMFCFWNMQRALEPMFSNNDFHPKANVIENSCFSGQGRGDFASCASKALESIEWSKFPWEIACFADANHSEKIQTGDPVLPELVTLSCGSSTELDQIDTSSTDLVITDPPFGGLLQYSELSDFFYVWLRQVLSAPYPNQFSSELTPKALEVVANRAREAEGADAFYQRLLTQCWREVSRILRPGGILAFTFHHSEDEPWVAVLESLFDAGFYLEATYPIRSDESKGEGDFGSKTIEYDIIHVCRKRTEEPTAVSWGRMRREVLADVRQMQAMLENHAKEGLPAADIQVIRRGKALEYFSRHYGKVYVDEGRAIGVKDALVGINQLIDEDSNKVSDPPPVNAEPITRQFLRIFEGTTKLARDQMQKFLRGSGIAPDEFEQRGWCVEQNKVFMQADPLVFARDWHGRHKRRLTSDLDQALVLMGACFDGSGINAADTLKNENFKPHPALKSLLDWMSTRGATTPIRNAAARAVVIYNGWAAANQAQVKQMSLFLADGGE